MPTSTKAPSENGKPGKKSKSSKAKAAENVPVYVPNVPEPTCRAELTQHWINLTLDDKTANRMLWISDGGSKVCRRTKEMCPVLDRPERYDSSPQVLCKEAVWNMRVYWEVEISGWVVIGASYEGAARKADSGPSGLGENEESWGLCWSGSYYEVWYNSINEVIRNVPFCPIIGVYIDQPAGVICFYRVSVEGEEKVATLLYRFQTTFEKKILPGFWMGIESACTLLKKS